MTLVIARVVGRKWKKGRAERKRRELGNTRLSRGKGWGGRFPSLNFPNIPIETYRKRQEPRNARKRCGKGCKD